MARNPQSGGDVTSMESTIFDNFGIDPASEFGNDDLGAGDQDLGDDDLGDDSGDLGADDDQGGGDEFNVDDLSVSHTDRQERRPQPKQRQQQDDQQLKPLAPQAGVKADKKGNLVNAAGQIVAKAGKEARLYQQVRKHDSTIQGLRSHVTNVESRLTRAIEIAQELNGKIQTFEGHNEAIAQFQMTPQQQLEAMTLYAQGRANPVQLLRNLLTKAQASGITMEQITGAAGGVMPQGGLDPTALATALEPLLKPVKDMAEQQRQERERNDALTQTKQKTTQEVQDFFNLNAEAKPFMPVFAKVLADPRYQNLTLNEIWLRIQLNQARSGGRDLRQPSRQNRRPAPRGPSSGRGFTGQQSGRTPPAEMADVNKSYDQILRETMAELNV